MASELALEFRRWPSVATGDQPRLLHYGNKPVTSFRRLDAPQSFAAPKPTGLWVSVEGKDDWKSWCDGESFRPDSMRSVSQIRIAEGARILHLACSIDIELFGDCYQSSNQLIAGSPYRHNIDWLRVANKYQGIIIAPYCWTRRHENSSFWYYGWDCASGCIWDGDAIAEIMPCPS